MDLSRQAITLCSSGIQAEFERRIGDARLLYAEAWECAADDYEKCVAAHYIAHLESNPDKALDWNLKSLQHAQTADAELVAKFLPSLYVNLGYSYEMVGDEKQSAHYYRLSAELGLNHQPSK